MPLCASRETSALHGDEFLEEQRDKSSVFARPTVGELSEGYEVAKNLFREFLEGEKSTSTN
jgi:hypothetical protein